MLNFIVGLAIGGSPVDAAAVAASGPSVIVGPWGAGGLELLSLPDLTIDVDPSTGLIQLHDPHSGKMVEDGEWSPSTTTSFDHNGSNRWVGADAAGRVERITWASGRRCTIERDELGRVAAVYGPGPGQKRVRYESGLLVEDTLGAAQSIASEDGRVWLIRDASGRQVRLTLDPETGEVSSWEDPRGLSTVVHRRMDVTEVVGPGGAVWRVGALELGGFVEQPNGLRWSWSRNDAGNITRIIDPSGAQADWRYDTNGLVVEAERAGRRTVVERDSEGHPIAITDPGGATVRIRWENGRVVQMTDASGAAVVLERDATGQLDAVLNRSGGRWEFQRDLDGRLQRLTDPAGRFIRVAHDGAGRVSSMEVKQASVRVERDSAGRITGVVDASGLKTGLLRDPTGRVREVRRPGNTVSIDRDAAGEIVGVRSDGLDVVVQRDVSGRAISAGPIAWTRDIMGWVDRLVAPGRELWFGHDAVGRLLTVRAAETVLRVVRDPHGDPIEWTGGGVPVRVERDRTGQVIVEDVGGRAQRATRGSRGNIERVDTLRGAWKWARGVDAGVLRVEGPDGLGVGADRDDAGRMTLARLPAGGLLRRAYREGVVYEQLTDGGGEVVALTSWAPDLQGRIAHARSEGGTVQTWTDGPDGHLASIVVGDGPDDVWSFSDGIVTGPGGWIRMLDVLGRTTELTIGDTWPVWGAIGGSWLYSRDAGGTLAVVRGNGNAFTLEHDEFGWLRRVRRNETEWTVGWDAIGRPHKVVRPSTVHDIVWAPGQVAGIPLATGEGAEVAWMDTGLGAFAWSQDLGSRTVSAGAVILPGERTTRVEDALGLIPIQWAAGTGVMDSAALDPLGLRGGVLLFPGGPELFAGGALDPASNERTDGTLDWPWVRRSERARVKRHAWDAAQWDPVSQWGQPLALAHQLGIVDIPSPTGAEVGPVAWPWLPSSYDRPQSTIGPVRGDVSLESELEPIVWRVLEHLRNGVGPISGDALLGSAVYEQDLGDLPPGLTIPGLTVTTDDDVEFSAGVLPKKLVASWGGVL